ncbi:MAG: hypothetical protein WC562_03420 [Dehalococcoidia bacterium]
MKEVQEVLSCRGIRGVPYPFLKFPHDWGIEGVDAERDSSSFHIFGNHGRIQNDTEDCRR